MGLSTGTTKQVLPAYYRYAVLSSILLCGLLSLYYNRIRDVCVPYNLAALDVTVERFLECYMKRMWCACVISATGMHFKCPLACMGVDRCCAAR